MGGIHFHNLLLKYASAKDIIRPATHLGHQWSILTVDIRECLLGDAQRTEGSKTKIHECDVQVHSYYFLFNKIWIFPCPLNTLSIDNFVRKRRNNGKNLQWRFNVGIIWWQVDFFPWSWILSTKYKTLLYR